MTLAPSISATPNTGLEAKPRPRPVSEVLDPEFCVELQANAKAFDATQENADNSKWTIAKTVNDMWVEHKGQFADKRQYYEECSRVANIGLKKKRFSDSGETLRRWCEVQVFYAPFSFADKLLDVYTFAHLIEIKRLVSRGKVNAVTEALHEAAVNKWTSDELREHYDPTQPPHPYELVQGRLAGLQNVADYPFLKDRAKAEECAAHAAAIEKIIREELDKEGKAV
jgi:hypothetical protein